MTIISSARQLDQFYTNKSVVYECLEYLGRIVPARSPFYVEPSAGAGAFFVELPAKSRLGLDLAPNHPQVKSQDFLLFDNSVLPKNRDILVVGNPPFGRNSSLALKFINKAAQFADVVAFVLPKTFRKPSVINKIDRNLHCVGELELPPFSFTFNDEPYDVPCVFQVWVKSEIQRELILSPKSHPDFNFVSAYAADFAIRRVGGLAGKVIRNFNSYAQSSHYYIKAQTDVLSCQSVFESINWGGVKYNTAGNPSISKPEIVALYASVKASAGAIANLAVS